MAAKTEAPIIDLRDWSFWREVYTIRPPGVIAMVAPFGCDVVEMRELSEVVSSATGRDVRIILAPEFTEEKAWLPDVLAALDDIEASGLRVSSVLVWARDLKSWRDCKGLRTRGWTGGATVLACDSDGEVPD